jgi:hypothetical protein
LQPNRKTGVEVNQYFCDKYAPDIFVFNEFSEVVQQNIFMNDFYKEKLPKGVLPQIVTYTLENSCIFVGIDLISGYIHVEGENLGSVEEIYDDLFVFRGLDEKDIENYFLVAQYIQCSRSQLAES